MEIVSKEKNELTEMLWKRNEAMSAFVNLLNNARTSGTEDFGEPSEVDKLSTVVATYYGLITRNPFKKVKDQHLADRAGKMAIFLCHGLLKASYTDIARSFGISEEEVKTAIIDMRKKLSLPEDCTKKLKNDIRHIKKQWDAVSVVISSDAEKEEEETIEDILD